MILQRIELFRIASDICCKWTSRIGNEFDPDTGGNDYEQAMSAAWVNEYNKDMSTLRSLPANPYSLIETFDGAEKRRQLEKRINAPPVAIYRSRRS